ncbi:sensor histidine kinase [Lichenicola sp.]|uniref:sensor histidine kinase n=1 Tax=Lichenicola sp. TaxID=2804529 RepID=UPI003B00836E
MLPSEVHDESGHTVRHRRASRILDSVSARLMTIILLSVLPMAALAALLAWHNFQTTRDASVTRAATVAQALKIRSDEQVSDVERMLRALAQQPGLQNPGDCHALLRLAMAFQGAQLSRLDVLDSGRSVVCGDPAGPASYTASDPVLAPPAAARSAVHDPVPTAGVVSLRPVLPTGPHQTRPMLQMSLGLAVPGNGSSTLVAEMPLGWNRDELERADLWRSMLGPRGQTEAWLVSRDGQRLPLCNDCGWTGQADAARSGDVGSALEPLIGDVSLLVLTQPSRQERLARSTFLWRVLSIMALLAAGMSAVAMGADVLIVAPLKAITQSVKEWRRAGAYDPGHTRMTPVELRQLSRAFTQATGALAAHEERLRRAEAKQELLIKEIHHRVKNNLQIIASLLNLQANRIRQPEARAEFASARDRVRALATLHRYLYSEGELHTLNMKSFLEELCGQLFQAIGEKEGRRIRLEIEAPEIVMSTDQAVPLALVVTEAVSNAIKYAFPAGRSGLVSVKLAEETEGFATLVIEDDGIGIPAGRAETETGIRDGLGIQLIRGFARQLAATLEVVEGRPGTEKPTGTRYTLLVPLHPKVETYSEADELAETPV